MSPPDHRTESIELPDPSSVIKAVKVLVLPPEISERRFWEVFVEISDGPVRGESDDGIGAASPPEIVVLLPD